VTTPHNNTRLGVAIGDTMPGNRNDCRAYPESGVDQHCDGAHVMADGGYQGNPEGSCRIANLARDASFLCGRGIEHRP
jgi:hypothetical protein